MSSSNSPQTSRPKPQSRACEACRTAKIRCQVGPQPGICKRCFDFKRECIFRTGPRTRRPKVPKGTELPPPPPGPSKVFSIDFSMPAEEEPSASFEELRGQHAQFLNEIISSSEEEEEEEGVRAAGSSSEAMFHFSDLPTPASTTSSSSKPLVNLGIKPQFNLDSAEKLFQTFRKMLPSCPCIAIDDDSDVRSMAKTSPFVLLAILAAASSSTSLQGHSLYDEEFRKVLGLKFVTAGERSLELLQGILIYCTWYPFHLRPRHRQAFQYLKMAVDTIHDLDIDQEEQFAARIQTGLAPDDFASFRSLLTCYYFASVYANTWKRPSTLAYSDWIARCCDLLEQYSTLGQDHVLVWLIRLHHISDELTTYHNDSKKVALQSDHHRALIRKGVETQLREWQSRMPTTIAIMPSITISSFFDDIQLVAMPLMTDIIVRSSVPKPPLDPGNLMSAAHTLRGLFEYIVTLPPDAMQYFCGADWGRLIVSIILASRLSLPVDRCPAFDASQARQVLNFSDYLAQLCRDPEDDSTKANRRTDCESAFRIVLGSLKARFDKKVAAAEAKEELIKRAHECPMLDGSLDEYITMWDGHDVPQLDPSLMTSQSSTSGVMTDPSQNSLSENEEKQSVFHDLWTTMTLGWSVDGTIDQDMSTEPIDFLGY
ncbi:hypothetical protein BX600DRAFT_311706 [Xylariales sp. PMI_506]|nr:hypothetical protein BX600DRAFT_311706 [Xylariales sp. PMI_506]